ncbi:MAG: hypothetical protein ACOX3P_00870 [Saccharofermentanales bacterium]|nr:hypothetical protein [Bacillota bacterium]NLB08203.1 hypothetical protein [Clostridiales bacterium]
MDYKGKGQLEQEIIELDQDWEQYLQGIEAKGLGLTLEQYKVYESLTGEESEKYLLENSTKL